MHFLTAVRTLYGYLVNERTVKLNIIRAVITHFLKLSLASYNMYLTTITDPGRKRCSPISVS